MTTPTTNYGWLKPNPTEPADIRVINTLMDDMDADIKAVSDTLTSKTYRMAQYRIKRKVTMTGDGTVWMATSSLNDLWEEEWVSAGNTGSWDMQGTGKLSFSSPGIYKICYLFTASTYVSSTTSGTLSIGLYKSSDSSQVRRAKVYHRSNTCDNVNIFPRTTMHGAVYIWAGAGSDQCALSTDYQFGLQNRTTAGSIAMLFTPNDLLPFRSQLTIECVRKLAS
jgi:hypothetical protein